MTIKQLHYFIAVAETLSFTQAARRFFVAQTAISQQIAALEKELNVLLFRRNNRHVELTEAGASFYREIRPLVIRLEDAIQAASDADRRTRRQFRIGLTPDVPATVLPDILRQFHESFPSLSLNLQRDSEKELFRPLKNGDLDVAVVAGQHNPDQRLVAEVLLAGVSEPLFLLAVYPGHQLYDRESVFWSDLMGEAFIVNRDITASPGFAELESFVRPLAAACPHSADSIEGILALVSAGLGLALIPAYAYGLVPHPLRLIRLTPCPTPQPVALYYHRNNSRPELADFLELCRRAFSSNSGN